MVTFPALILVYSFFVHLVQGLQLIEPQNKNSINHIQLEADTDKTEKHNVFLKKTDSMPSIDITKLASSNKKNKSEPANVSLNKINHMETIIANVSYIQGVGKPKIDHTFENKTEESESGAFTRGIMVFVAISFLFIVYVGIKTYRRKSRDKSRIIIRKYGVRARPSDVEMEPLPLSDDEDETVFELGPNINR